MDKPQAPAPANHSAHSAESVSPEAEWLGLQHRQSEDCRALLCQIVAAQADTMAERFYAGMMAYPQAARFLDHDKVHTRLHGSMVRWIHSLFPAHPLDEAQAASLVAVQRHVGEVHARIQLPIYLVARGARLLKQDLFTALEQSTQDLSLLQRTQAHVSRLMDLALELMSAGHLQTTERVVRTDEAYRLFSLGQNISVEREKQRSLLLEWAHEVLFSLYRNAVPGPLPRLGQSEFGLWFTHKAAAMFEGAAELDQITEIMERVDAVLIPQFSAGEHGLLWQLEADVNALKFLVSTLFERNMEVENSRDPLTRLLNRRFLPAVLNREIRVAEKRHSSFALLLLDVDHFKAVNDQYGHDSGDLVLQQAAALILNSVRNGDFVFRFGGEEVLIMVVEATPAIATRVAENIRAKFDSTPFLLSEGRELRVTVSIGVALYDGHPDHQYLMNRADQALYRAKHSGRNQVQVSE